MSQMEAEKKNRKQKPDSSLQEEDYFAQSNTNHVSTISDSLESSDSNFDSSSDQDIDDQDVDSQDEIENVKEKNHSAWLKVDYLFKK